MRGSFKSMKSQYSSAQEDVGSGEFNCSPVSPSTTIVEYVNPKNGQTATTASTTTIATTDVEYGTTWIAWVQVVNIMLVNGCCSLMWGSGSSAPHAVSEWLHVNYTALNWLSNSSAVINTFFSLITGWSYQRFGIKPNVQ